MEAGRESAPDGELHIFPERYEPGKPGPRHLALRAVVVACFLLLALVSLHTLVQIYRMSALLTGPVFGYLAAVPGLLLVLGLSTAVLVALGRNAGWHLALAMAICLLAQQLTALIVQFVGSSALPPDLRWPFWLAGTLLTIVLLVGTEFRTVFGVSATSSRRAVLAWSAVSVGLALLVQGL